MTRWHAELAWLADGAVAADVLLETAGDRLVAVTPGVPRPPDAVGLAGLTLPGLANGHSHAFHRALRGRTQTGAGDFWAWRERMYVAAGRLDPDSYRTLAAAAFAEMAAAGITVVGEFHYLHHAAGGRRYADPNAMGRALVEAAGLAGVRLTLLDACYLRAGLAGEPLAGVQARFGDGTVGAWAERAAELHDAIAGAAGATGAAGARDGAGAGTVLVGAAAHSVRAVAPDDLAAVAGWAVERGRPVHLHLSEQPAENRDCLAVTGRTPTELVAAAGLLGPAATAVHATHLTPGDVSVLGASGTAVCLCPTTERDLADGVGPAAALAAAGSPLCLGSDSHAVVDLFEEARAVELDERLVTGRRGQHPADALLVAATAAGYRALGWPLGGRLAPGALADFVTVDLASPRTAGADAGSAVAAAVFAATAADVRQVVVAGRPVVVDGVHLRFPELGEELARAVRDLWSREPAAGRPG